MPCQSHQSNPGRCQNQYSPMESFPHCDEVPLHGARTRHPVTLDPPSRERALAVARRVKTALTLGSQVGGRRRESARLARVAGDGVCDHPGAGAPPPEAQ